MKSETTTTSFNLPVTLKKRLAAQAKREHRSASSLVAVLLEEGLEARGTKGGSP